MLLLQKATTNRFKLMLLLKKATTNRFELMLLLQKTTTNRFKLMLLFKKQLQTESKQLQTNSKQHQTEPVFVAFHSFSYKNFLQSAMLYVRFRSFVDGFTKDTSNFISL